MTHWRTLNDQTILDIDAFVRESTRAGQAVHVGADSLQTGKVTQFCTVIAILTPGKGGRAVYCRETVPRIKSLRDRLFKEVWRSVEVAMSLSRLAHDVTVHLDVNPSERFKSSKYVQELVGLVVGQGFAFRVKPDAFAASVCADHIVRTMGKLPRAA